MNRQRHGQKSQDVRPQHDANFVRRDVLLGGVAVLTTAAFGALSNLSNAQNASSLTATEAQKVARDAWRSSGLDQTAITTRRSSHRKF
jgi:hypothetical protein